ncbi:MAG: hypothetical protein R8G66_34190 [Cytophagales bacterium]|nr:hypothetical protein [Cytophagales bacterium]
MEERTQGAWVIHHTKKIREFKNAPEFEDIELAGKCGLFLSSLAASKEQSYLNANKVNTIAEASNINKRLELPIIKDTLQKAKLIDISSKGDISVLGITTSKVLDHTSQIFKDSTTDDFQKASLELANYSSDRPVQGDLVKEYISDTYHLSSEKNKKLFQLSEEIGLIDYEEFDSEKVYFNGNLFRRDAIAKTSKVLSSLSDEDSRKITEVDNLIKSEGCITQESAIRILGSILLSKLQSIAMYDFNEVSNNQHSMVFITKPSSFSKFGNPFEDDALDMAKAFIASLTYGMKISSPDRGQIQGHSMLVNTIRKLLRGESVGPCTAIGQDYLVLVVNRVIELKHSRGSLYSMRLLKFDIGRLALDVLEKGDSAEQASLELDFKSSSVTNYTGPEDNRMRIRRKKSTSKKINVGELLRTMRN